MYAVIRVRGTVNVSPKIKTTLELMNLRRANNLSLWPKTVHSEKMIKRVKDYTTFGVVSDEVLKELLVKRARPIKPTQEIDAEKVFNELKKGKSLKELGIKNCFTLNPPKKGFERKGIKVAFVIGGALGNRKEKINELIKKMV